ncbi:MAG: hypothetical protein D6725_15630 [Planctomycetota bacterium]|nr:MAG: hypothetical protein D6725_15630 [Planctomycetota bacterium]
MIGRRAPQAFAVSANASARRTDRRDGMNAMWYLFPLAAGISLVYSASRFEQPKLIVLRAVRMFWMILLTMGAVMLLLFALSWNL